MIKNKFIVTLFILSLFFVCLKTVSAEPIGSIIAYAGEEVPSNYLLCDGQEVSREDYAKLFDAIGTMYGYGDSTSTFNVPDYRGYFLRGVDGGAGVDPDRYSRMAREDGVYGDVVGSIQDDELIGHVHGVTDPGHGHVLRDYAWSAGGGPDNVTSMTVGNLDGWQNVVLPSFTGISIQSTGGAETRSKNKAVFYIIRWE